MRTVAKAFKILLGCLMVGWGILGLWLSIVRYWEACVVIAFSVAVGFIGLVLLDDAKG